MRPWRGIDPRSLIVERRLFKPEYPKNAGSDIAQRRPDGANPGGGARPWSEIEAERLDAIEEWNREIRKFIAKQQPLGKEFEQVLCDNLWELYVRS